MIKLHRMPEITETAVRLLRRGGSSDSWDEIISDLLARKTQLFHATNGSYLVLSITSNDELFIHACAGSDAKILMQLCIQTARHNHCTSVLFKTIKKGLVRLLTQFNAVEIKDCLYRVEI